jgi:hypothetical protein
MAKLHKISAYLIDTEGRFNDTNLEDYILYRLYEELDMDHFHVESADIGPWHDDHPVNKYGCHEEEYEKYFKEN